MKISVTQDRIHFGIARSSCGCPVARAIRPHMVPSWSLEVSSTHIVFRHQNLRHTVWTETPADAVEFIRRYDAVLPVEPFAFELPEPWRVFE